MSKKIRIATVFSGIGAFEKALEKQHQNYDIGFACDNGEREIDKSYEEIMEYAKENGLSNSQLNEYVDNLYLETKKKNWMKESCFANYNISEDKWYNDVRFIDGEK